MKITRAFLLNVLFLSIIAPHTVIEISTQEELEKIDQERITINQKLKGLMDFTSQSIVSFADHGQSLSYADTYYRVTHLDKEIQKKFEQKAYEELNNLGAPSFLLNMPLLGMDIDWEDTPQPASQNHFFPFVFNDKAYFFPCAILLNTSLFSNKPSSLNTMGIAEDKNTDDIAQFMFMVALRNVSFYAKIGKIIEKEPNLIESYANFLNNEKERIIANSLGALASCARHAIKEGKNLTDFSSHFLKFGHTEYLTKNELIVYGQSIFNHILTTGEEPDIIGLAKQAIANKEKISKEKEILAKN